MAQTKRPQWLIVLPVLFTLITGLGLALILAFSELAEMQDWDEGTVQTMSVVFQMLGVVNLVLLAEWIRPIAERRGYGLLGTLGIVSLFTLAGVRIFFVTGDVLPVFVAGAFAVVYALKAVSEVSE